MIETASSSFSVNAMARSPCRGTMSPTTKAPAKGSVMGWLGRGIRQTEDCVDADNIGKERGPEHQEDNERHETLGWSVGD